MSDAAAGPPINVPNIPPFEVSPYRPDGGFTGKNSALLLASYLVAGTVLGVIAFFVSKLIWLIVIFPMLIGFILGGIGIAIVKKTKIRSPILAGVGGFLGGCLAMLAMHYTHYLNVRSTTDPDELKLAELPEEQREALIRAFIPAEKQVDARRDLKMLGSFGGFMEGLAEIGVQIKGTRNQRESNLGYVGSYIYWGVEVLIIAGIALGMVWSAARMPFCTVCETWKTPLPMATLAMPASEVNAAVHDGEPWRVLRDMPPAEREVSDLLVDCCPNCQEDAPIELHVKRRVWNKKNEVKVKELERVTYPGAALPVLVVAFQPAPAELASAIEHEELPPEQPAAPQPPA